ELAEPGPEPGLPAARFGHPGTSSGDRRRPSHGAATGWHLGRPGASGCDASPSPRSAGRGSGRDEPDLRVLAAVAPADADVAVGAVEGGGGAELAGVDAAAVAGAAGVVVERGGRGDGEVEGLGAPGPGQGAGDVEGAAGQRLVDLERGLGGEPRGPGLVHGGVGEAGEGAGHLEVGGELETGDGAGQGAGAVPGDGVDLRGVAGAGEGGAEGD